MVKNLFLLLIVTITFKNYSQKPSEIGKNFILTTFVNKDFEISYSFFDQPLFKEFSISSLSEVVSQIESHVGPYKGVIEVNNESNIYYFYSEFENQKLDITLTFNTENKIIGFFFVPHKEFKKENFIGKELNIKSGNLELNGTLLTPENDSLKKLVIFIHGSGPNDRDETIFENKPFKDVSESLYKRGIASYRFDKKVFSNPESFNDNSTIDEEITNDILDIINYFKNDNQFSNYEIIILGHSLGAYLTPRIINKSNKVSKAIMLAGNARSLDKLIIEQYNYLYELNPTEDLKNELGKLKNQIFLLHSKRFNLNTSKENLPLNLSANYWQSILDYNPLKEGKKIKIPMLILHGERDYQVTMKDFELWKKSLDNNKKATFISYPKLNHLFITGDKKSEPKEYMIKGTVDEMAINDIFNFIQKK